MAYLRRCPENVSLPASINDLVKGIHNSKYELDDQLQDVLLAFWNDMGVKIKGYRDQANHKAIILSNCVAFTSPKGAGLKMLLPDDPHEKRPSELRYDPGVPAMGFALDALKKTIQCVNVVVERLIDLMSQGDPNARTTGVVGPAIRGGPWVFETKISGEPVPFPLTVSKVVAIATRRTEV